MKRKLEVTIVALLAAAAMPVTHGAETISGPDAGWAAVTRCAQQDGERARHACVDQVLRDAGLLTPEKRAREKQREFGLESKAAAPSPAAAPRVAVPPVPARPAARQAPPVSPATPAPVSPPPAPPAAPAEPSQDRIDVQVASSVTSADGKLTLTTNEGAVWRQTEAMTIYQPPKAGDRVTIRKGALGAYLCTLASKITYHCARSR